MIAAVGVVSMAVVNAHANGVKFLSFNDLAVRCIGVQIRPSKKFQRISKIAIES